MNRLGMTEEQMITEIEFMREWDKFLRANLPTEQYDMLCMAMARQKTTEELRNLGATEEEIEETCAWVERSLGYGTEIQ